MTILKLFFSFMTLLSCENMNDKAIIVTGKAEDLKDVAIVISNKDQKIYYVDGLFFWNEKFIGKTVKVTGKLKIENKEAPKKGEDIPQQVTGIKRIIINPKCELIN
jgi:hypothetical protein